MNCTVTGNTLLNNSIGICIDYSDGTLISGNNINNNFFGIYIYASNHTTISKNTVTGNNGVGIYVGDSSSAVITGNDISNNPNDGVVIYYSSADVHFNRIVGNGQHGLASEGSYCNATNNWWGTNNPTVVSSSMTGDIRVYSGMVLYNPWLVLTVTPTSYKVVDGKVYEATITADFNHNSGGEYPLTLVHVPDGIPVNFTTDNGTITNTSITVKGEASSTLVLDPNLQSGLTNVTAIVDGQSVSNTVDRTANAIIHISSTAIDLSTGQPLSLYYELPLNESVSWVSVLWKSTSSNFGTFQNEVNLIVNGVVVLNRTVSNLNYTYNKDLFSQKVWYNVNFLNWLFSESTASKNALQSIINQNPQLQNLTGSDLIAGILNIIKERNGFTDSEMSMIANYRYFTDDITTYIEYPGDAYKKITFEDPDNGELVDLNFPGNPIYRTSTMIYANGGYLHVQSPGGSSSLIYKDEGYEGVRSFAIVTERVTDEILQYWLDEKDKKDENGALLYQEGPMKAAYGTFLASLLVVYGHDVVADAAASEFNVSWVRTTPIVVSCVDDATATYITGEMDHRMGMDVVGDPENLRAFRYACSSAFSPIEYWVGAALFPVYDVNGTRIYENSSFLGSVTMGIGYLLLSGKTVEVFESNGYTFIRVMGDNNNILVIDPETGIVRDGSMGKYFDEEFTSGSYCYGDQQTELGYGFGNSLLDNKDAINRAMETGEDVPTDHGQESDEWQDEVLGLAGSTAISIAVAALPFLIAAGPVGWIAAGALIGVGLAASWYAADMDENMYSTSNQIKFALNVGPALVPYIGWESNFGKASVWMTNKIGGKLIVEQATSKGTSKELFNIPKNYKGYIVQNIKRTSQDPIYGPLADFTSIHYINYGSPEGVLRLAYGWTKEEIAKSLVTDFTCEVISYEVDRNSEYIDGAFGYKKYNSTEEYLASV